MPRVNSIMERWVQALPPSLLRRVRAGERAIGSDLDLEPAAPAPRPTTAAAIGGLTSGDAAAASRYLAGGRAMWTQPPCRSCVCEDNKIEGGCCSQGSGWSRGAGTGRVA